eukprot:CAMPEP_0169322264 /NCGR_PEP_ID=MMETSP1017-20121227/9329_1 /TAXON_ID=342587 /ORGANISM="Karlodinium micrum, Strain CCMP2283" /LENGTH=1744 /DNA_ID=CAMNT_0009416799 /DNA_START=24 /DNA_END=5258 /DNA_ORIENTATION=+
MELETSAEPPVVCETQQRDGEEHERLVHGTEEIAIVAESNSEDRQTLQDDEATRAKKNAAAIRIQSVHRGQVGREQAREKKKGEEEEQLDSWMEGQELQGKAQQALEVALLGDDDLREKAQDALEASLLGDDNMRDKAQTALGEAHHEVESVQVSAKPSLKEREQEGKEDKERLARESQIGERDKLEERLELKFLRKPSEASLESESPPVLTEDASLLAEASARRAKILRDERQNGLLKRLHSNILPGEGTPSRRRYMNTVAFPLHNIGGSTKSAFAQVGETKIPDKKWHRRDRPAGPGDSLIDKGEEEVKQMWQMDLVSDRGQLRNNIHDDRTVFDTELEPWKLLPAGVIQQDLMPGEETKNSLGLSYSSYSSFFGGLQRQTSGASSQEPDLLLRTDMHNDTSEFDMELEPWPMLDADVIADDVCTESQLLLGRIRDQCGSLSRPAMERRRLVIQKHFVAAGSKSSITKSNAVSDPRFFEEIRPLGKEVEMIFFSFTMGNVDSEKFMATANAKIHTWFVTTVRETIADLAGYSTLPFQVHVDVSGNFLVNARIMVPSSLLYLVQARLCEHVKADSGGSVVEAALRDQIERVPGFMERIVVGDQVTIQRTSVLSSLDPVPFEDRANRSDNFVRYVELYDPETGSQSEAILAKVKRLHRDLPLAMAPETVEKKLVYYYTQETSLYRLVNQCLRLDEEEGIKYYAGYIRDLRDVFQRQNLHFLSCDKVLTPKPFMGTAYRGVKLLQWEDQYKIEREFVWPAFTSTSTNVEVACGKEFAGDPSGVLFEIHCCNMPLPAHCYVPVDISHLSYYGATENSEGEKEVLFPPHVRFRVSNIDTKDIPVRIILETVECPSVWDIIKARDWTLFEEWAEKNSRRMNTADCDKSIINRVAQACADTFSSAGIGTLKPLEICVSKGADLEELDPESNETPLDKLAKAAESCPESAELQSAVKWIQQTQQDADVFKVVALVNGRLYSIFDGVTEYVVGKRLESKNKARPAYRGGLYVMSSAERAMRSKFPQHSKLLLAPRVLIGCRAHGKRVECDDGGFAISGLTPLEVLAIETTTQLMPNVKAREIMNIDYTEWIAISPGSPLQEFFRSADSNGFQDFGAVAATSTMAEQKELLATVDIAIQDAKNLQRRGEVRKAVQLLQRVYRKTESSEAPIGFGNNGSIASKLAKGQIRLQLASIYSSLSKHREALEEAVYGMLETDAAWQAMLASAGAGTSKQAAAERAVGNEDASASDSRPPSAAATPAAILSALLLKPPPWLERAAELSVRARCRASSELRSAFFTAITEAATESRESEAARKEEALREAASLLQEAEMLARHFLPEDHSIRRLAERDLQELEAGWADPELPSNEGISRPTTSPKVSKLPPIARLESSLRLPAADDPRLAKAVSQPNIRATTGTWNGRAPNGDMFYTTMPKYILPRITTNRKKARRAAQANISESQLKRAAGCAGGMTRSASAILAPQVAPTNAFEDWQSSFDDPMKHDVKRMVMRSDEAARRFKGGLKSESYHFKSQVLPMFSSDEMYAARIKYSGFGMYATKIGERLANQREKKYAPIDSNEANGSLGKKETKRDLFRRYGIELKGEPGLATLGRLLEESAKGRPRKKDALRTTLANEIQVKPAARRQFQKAEDNPRVDLVHNILYGSEDQEKEARNKLKKLRSDGLGVFGGGKMKVVVVEPEPEVRTSALVAPVARQWEDDDDLPASRSGIEAEVEEAVVEMYQTALTRTASLGST